MHLPFLHSYNNRLHEWCTPRVKSQSGYEFLKQTFAYDPDKRLTAREALKHKWFTEDPVPTAKSVSILSPLHPSTCLVVSRLKSAYWLTELKRHKYSIFITDTRLCSAFQSLPTHQIPPHRRITQDDAPSMMPLPTANTHAQAAAQVQAQAQAQLSQQLTQSHSAKGSVASFGSNGGGGGGPARKKSRLG